LPAQFSAIQSLLVDDFDKDGEMDVLAAGNWYSPDVMTGRYDASIGLLLKGDGKGNFAAVPAGKSGIWFKGDVRSMAPININNSNALIVAANSARLMIYKRNK
jgi:hypothetical protein